MIPGFTWKNPGVPTKSQQQTLILRVFQWAHFAGSDTQDVSSPSIKSQPQSNPTEMIHTSDCLNQTLILFKRKSGSQYDFIRRETLFVQRVVHSPVVLTAKYEPRLYES